MGRNVFDRRNEVVHLIASESPQREAALLRILIATGEKAIEAFQASANPKDTGFLSDLERIIQRSREELAVLDEQPPPRKAPGSS
jgi:hypothetical protein